MCAITEKLSADPTKVVSGDWDPLRDIGFNDQACLEVAHIVGVFNYLTRLADGFGLQVDLETLEARETGERLQRDADS